MKWNTKHIQVIKKKKSKRQKQEQSRWTKQKGNSKMQTEIQYQ